MNENTHIKKPPRPEQKHLGHIYTSENQIQTKKIPLKYLKKNIVEKEKFIGGDEYLLSILDLKLEDEDITKWTKNLQHCQI